MIMIGSDGVIQFMNSETERMFGYPTEELIGQSIDVVVPAHFRDRHAALREAFMANPIKRPMGSGRDLTAVRRDGTAVPVEIGLTPIQTSNGIVVLATIVDISDRKKIENAIMQHAAELEAAVNGAVDGIVMIDENGIIQWLNPAAGCLFGYDAAELVGQNVTVLMPDPYRGEHDGYLRNYLRTGKAKIIGIGRAVEGRRKDGSMFPLDLAVNIVPVAGKRLFAGFVHDLSERRKLEARLEELHADRLKAMGEMASALAHEINQPLAATATYLRTVRRLLKLSPDKRPATIEDIIDYAVGQVIRAGRIVSNLREFAAGGEPNKTQQNLHELIRDVCELMSGAMNQGHVGILCELNAEKDRIIADKKSEIKQVFVNLFLNAIESMSGCPKRELTITTRSTEEGTIQIDVGDTGCGFPDELKARLFEPFTGTKIKGMGVGLSISRSIIEAHYGNIWASSKRGEGAKFSFTLPLAEPERVSY